MINGPVFIPLFRRGSFRVRKSAVYPVLAVLAVAGLSGCAMLPGAGTHTFTHGKSFVPYEYKTGIYRGTRVSGGWLFAGNPAAYGDKNDFFAYTFGNLHVTYDLIGCLVLDTLYLPWDLATSEGYPEGPLPPARDFDAFKPSGVPDSSGM